jgi:hypothetical protein
MDETTPTGQPTGGDGGPEPSDWPGADTIGATPPDDATADTSRSAAARDAMTQLQAMIDSIATHAAPVARQIGAKAAELAAVAGERAGPIARRAADVTEEAGARLAERSRALAEDLRREPRGNGTPAAGGEDRLGTPADNPAEGPRDTTGERTESLGE